MKNKFLIIGGVLVLALIVITSITNKGEAPGTSPKPNGGTVSPPTGKTPPPPTAKTPPPPTTKVPPRVEQQPPKAPTNFTATPIGTGKVKLRLKVADLTQVDGFHITRSTRSDFADGEIIQPIAEAETEFYYFAFSDTTVVPSKTYYYRATAYNEAGDSPATSVISVTMPVPESAVIPDPVAISISGFKFNPGGLTIKKGTKVTWTNLDNASHTVTADTLSGPTSSLLPQGATYSYTFDTPGLYPYHCSPHPSMTGTITVTD